MKITTWNCNGAFRKKFEEIIKLNSDIYIIQECEDPNQTKDKNYKEFASNHVWFGDNKNKGIGVFAKPNIQLTKINWTNNYKDHSVKYFLPVLVNKQFQLLAVWAHHNNSPNFGYIGQMWKYLQINLQYFDKILIAGDLNSNVIWDQWDRWWNHSDVLNDLATKNIKSLYHLSNKVNQGKEKEPTLYLQRKLEKPYHIDYIFGSKYFQQKVEAVNIGKSKNWLAISDHMPLTGKFKNDTLTQG